MRKKKNTAKVVRKKVDKKFLLTLCKKKIKLYICRLFEVECAGVEMFLKYCFSIFYIFKQNVKERK